MDLDYALFEITRYAGYAYPVLLLACAIAALVRLPGLAARLLCGAGFGLMLLTNLYFLYLREAGPPFDSGALVHRVSMVFSILAVFGWVLVFVGILLVRGSRPQPVPAHSGRPGPRPPQGAPRRGAPPSGSSRSAPTRRTGWGLVGLWIGLSALSLLCSAVTFALIVDAGHRISSREAVPIYIAVGLGLLILIPAVAVLMIWLYLAWSAVPEEHRSASPGQAVGFLFIPFFSIYWAFRAIPGLSASIRRANEAIHGDRAGGAGFGVGVAACIIALIPWVGILAWPLFVIWVILANSAKNRMQEDLAQRG
jgi:hypothetical protein